MIHDIMEQEKARPRNFVFPEINFKFKKSKRHVLVEGLIYRRRSSQQSNNSKGSNGNASLDNDGGVTIPVSDAEEEDFFDIISRLQSSRINDQRAEMPTALLKHQNLKIEIGPPNEEQRDVEPIKQVLALGAPYPMVVLSVDGEYWMEGNYHILSRDMNDRPIFPSIDMSRCSLTEDNSVYSYRRNFLGKEHLNFAGIDNKHGAVLLSVLLDISVKDDEPDQYRVILRLKDRTIDKIIPTTIFETNSPGPRDFIRYLLDDDVEIDRFHPVSTLRASDDITKFDEHTVTNCYKVGVVLQKFGQTSEEEYLQNQGESPAFSEFLELLGTCVDLKDFPNYRGGLDVKYGQTGDCSYYANHKNRELMFHVSTLLPYTQNDSQQLNRKRHIGNDVVSIIFQEESTPFCPTSFRSHFLHVFIIIQVENPNTENTLYKVSITAKDGVSKFAPSLPTPCIFKKGPEFRNFLLTKILNAETAAVKSERFSTLAERTRTMLLQGLVNEIITKNEKLLEDDNVITQNDSSSKSGSLLSSFRSAISGRYVQSESTTSSHSTNLVNSRHSGQSFSLNDISSLAAEYNKKEAKRTSKEKKKGKKDKSPSNSTVSPQKSSTLTRHTRLSTNDLNDSGEVSPVLRHPLWYKTDSSSKPKSHFYNNQLFNFEGEVLQTQSLPKILPSSKTMNGQDSPSSPNDNRRNVNHHVDNNNVTDDEKTASLDAAQNEIEKLKAEINKLKMDKMDLARQNVQLNQLKEKQAPIITDICVKSSDPSTRNKKVK